MTAPEGATLWTDRAPSFELKGDVVMMTIGSGKHQQLFAMTRGSFVRMAEVAHRESIDLRCNEGDNIIAAKELKKARKRSAQKRQ